MLGRSTTPSFMTGGRTRRQEKPTGQTAEKAASEGASRLGKFGSAMKDKSKPTDMVTRLHDYGKAEVERKKKADAEKKKAPASTAPSKGFFGRMMDKYSGKKEE